MTELKTGDKAPEFTLPTNGDGSFSLSAHKGQKVILYFYPKDDTPGCTKQACGFRDNAEIFKKLGVTIIGISKDPVGKHDKFTAKHGLNFPLASDAESNVCEQYGVWVEKNMYGRKYMGINRTTFLIDEKGVIRQIWHKVKVDGHMDALKEAVSELSKAA